MMTRLPAIGTRAGLLGIALIALGCVLVGASAAYFVYARTAEADVSTLATSPRGGDIQALPKEWLDAQSADPAGAAQGSIGSAAGLPAQVGADRAVAPAAARATGLNEAPPADSSDPRYRWADWNSFPKALGEAPRASRVSIPIIGVDSPVVEVAIVDDGGTAVWQRPKNSIGHHAGTANSGEIGNAVLSGHINSPIRGEGSVFHRLPEISEHLKAGEPVEAFVYTPDKTYVYRVVKVDVLEPEDASPFNPTTRPTLTVITCVPDYVFSHRLVVTGLLVKVADGGSPSLGQTTEGPVVAPGGR